MVRLAVVGVASDHLVQQLPRSWWQHRFCRPHAVFGAALVSVDLSEGQQAHPGDRILRGALRSHLRRMPGPRLEFGDTGVLLAMGTQGSLHEHPSAHHLRVVGVRLLGQPHVYDVGARGGDCQDLRARGSEPMRAGG